MKYSFLLLVFPMLSHAETWQLKKASSSYEVKVKTFMKRVEGESNEIKGKMDCPNENCEILLAVPVKTYTSSDSNRDLNMQTTVESGKYPLATARGKFPKSELSESSWKLPAEIEFHGVKKSYTLDIQKNGVDSYKADFVLDLEAHKVKRPTLFGVSIQNEVPMAFNLEWSKI